MKMETTEDVLTDELAEELADTFRVLGNVTRLKVIALLREREMCVHELTEVLDVSQSAVSHQLGLLRRTRLVARRREGRHMSYRLDDEHVSDLFDRALEHLRHANEEES